jgi:zinc transporter 1/2/3
MTLLVSKIVSMIGLGFITWIIGVIPILGVNRGWSLKILDQSGKKLLLYSMLLCFGGGVILSSCMTHMLPDVREIYLKALAEGSFPDTGLEIPEIFVLAGFLLIYIIEEIAHILVDKCTQAQRDTELSLEKVDQNDNSGKKHPDSHGPHGHGHDIDLGENNSFEAVARGFLVILALCIHDLFEGIALGVARQESAVWFLLLAFASHKWVISACLGVKWSRSSIKALVSVIYISTFCIVSPIGIGIGMALTDPNQEGELMTSGLIIVQGIATGSLLYVTFFEILEKERQKDVSGIAQALSFTAGYIFMVLLGLAEVKSEQTETSGGGNFTIKPFV